MQEPDISRSVMAFDFGLARTGVAIGEIMLCIAHPLETIESRSIAECLDKVDKLIRKWQPGQLVVGLPSHADGTEHEMSKNVRRFARRLKDRFKLPVWLVDEKYTSVVAESMLEEAGRRRGYEQKNILDQVAAQAILSTWFDYHGEKV